MVVKSGRRNQWLLKALVAEGVEIEEMPNIIEKKENRGIKCYLVTGGLTIVDLLVVSKSECKVKLVKGVVILAWV